MVKTNLVMYVFFIIASDVVDCCRVTVFDIISIKRAKLRHLMYSLRQKSNTLQPLIAHEQALHCNSITKSLELVL